MKICYLAPADSYHTKKWCMYFASRGNAVSVISLVPGDVPEATVYVLDESASSYDSEMKKVAFLFRKKEISRLIDLIDPDVVHAHRLSSYGLLCALSCDRPYYLSVWGEDAYEFPNRSPLHALVARYSLNKATWLMSTSKVMATECKKYTRKKMEITPFGVDMGVFSPMRRIPHEGFVVGTVKALEKRYGIDCLLRACAALHDRRPDLDVKVRIAGRGTMEGELKDLGRKLGMESYINWLGFISQTDAAKEWACFDVACIESESESESFGVSAVEAQACGTPLVISDIPGLMEACDNGQTAVVVPRGDYLAAADAIERLADDSGLREEMGNKGRAYVENTYEVGACFDRVQKIYESHLEVQQ